MARGRWISPDFYDSTSLAQCSHSARLVFPALWQCADRSGVFVWDSHKLRKYAFGYDNIPHEKFEGFMLELWKGGFIKQGTWEGKVYGYIPNFSKRQTFHKDEKEKLGEIARGCTWLAPCQHSATPVPLQLSLETGDLRSETGDLKIVPTKISEIAHAEIETRPELSLTAPSAPVSKPKRKRDAVSPERQAKAKAIRIAYFDGYRNRYRKDPPWGPREWGQLYDLLGSWTPEDLLRLVPLFFAWPNRDVINAGWQWGKGSHCFVLKVGELDADVQAPERRAAAAVIAKRTQLADTLAQDSDQVARVQAIIDHENAHDNARRTAERMELPPPATPGPLDQSRQVAQRSAQQALERPGRDGLVHSPRPIRDRIGSLSSAGGILRGRSHAVDWDGEAPNGGQAGAVDVHATATDDAGTAGEE